MTLFDVERRLIDIHDNICNVNTDDVAFCGCEIGLLILDIGTYLIGQTEIGQSQPLLSKDAADVPAR